MSECQLLWNASKQQGIEHARELLIEYLTVRRKHLESGSPPLQDESHTAANLKYSFNTGTID